MTDGTKDKDPLKLLIGKLMEDLLRSAGGQPLLNSRVVSTKDLADMFVKPTTPDAGLSGAKISSCIFDDIPPLEFQLTYGEQLVGYDPAKNYNPAVAELLQNFADSIDILHNCKGTTPPAIRATETAIGHIQTACFWAQNAMTNSKL